jgi:hypothetical protein
VIDRACPRCYSPGRFLEGASKETHVDYYRCDTCGHVWRYDKENPSASPVDVTMRRPKAVWVQIDLVLWRAARPERKDHSDAPPTLRDL